MTLTTSECVRILGVETEFPWRTSWSHLAVPHPLVDVGIFMAAVGGLVPADGELKSTCCIPQNTAALETNSVLLLCRKVRTIPLHWARDLPSMEGFLTTWNPPRYPPRRRAPCRSR